MSNQEPEISLASYATVTACLGAGLPLRRALEVAGLQPAAWERDSERWQDEIAESAANDLVLLVAFDAELLTAKRRFEPTIEPIATDVRAFAHFRRHFLTAVEPNAFLVERGISLAAYARLEAEWTNKALSDEALAATLEQHMKAPLEECPTLTLVPSPLLLEAPRARPAPSTVAANVPSVPAHVAAPRLAPEHAQAKALPSFMVEQAKVEKPAPIIAPPQPVKPPPQVAPARPPGESDLGHTGVFDPSMLKGALPFDKRDTPSLASGPWKVPDAPRAPSMPSKASPKMPSEPSPDDDDDDDGDDLLAGTVIGATSPIGEALPFAAAPGPPRPSPASPPAGSLRASVPSGPSPLPFAPKAPPQPSPTQSAARPTLTLEYYTALGVELSLYPGRAAQIYPRYGLADAAAWEIVHADWQARLRADPTLLARWQQLVTHYRAYYDKR
jgi:hypothetical protein